MTFGAICWSRKGSLNSWKLPITENSRVSVRAGLSAGSLIARAIKLPALKPALTLTLLFSVIGSFQLFNEPFLLQQIAPNVIDSSYTANLYAYTLAFTGQQVNYAA